MDFTGSKVEIDAIDGMNAAINLASGDNPQNRRYLSATHPDLPLVSRH